MFNYKRIVQERVKKSPVELVVLSKKNTYKNSRLSSPICLRKVFSYSNKSFISIWCSLLFLCSQSCRNKCVGSFSEYGMWSKCCMYDVVPRDDSSVRSSLGYIGNLMEKGRFHPMAHDSVGMWSYVCFMSRLSHDFQHVHSICSVCTTYSSRRDRRPLHREQEICLFVFNIWVCVWTKRGM